MDVASSHHLNQNKIEVLRFIEILLSRTIYTSPSQVILLTNPFTSRLVHNHQTPRRLVLPILCSLLNTAMNAGSKAGAPATPTVGNVINGVGELVKELPYNHLLWKDESRIAVVSASFGVLVALLDYQSAEGRDIPVNASTPSTPGSNVSLITEGAVAPTAVTNSFRYFLAKLVKLLIYVFIMTTLISLRSTGLPTSSTF